MPRLRLLAIALLAYLALSNGAAQTIDEQPKTQPDVPAQYAATAFGESPSVAGRTFDLKVYVQELTSDGDIEELASTLRHKGQDGLASALDKIKYKGRVAPNGSVSTPMRVVRIRPTTDGGQHIVLASAVPGWQHQHRVPTANRLLHLSKTTNFWFSKEVDVLVMAEESVHVVRLR